jgi:hypothetical protein
MSFTSLLSAYLLGGVTFIPLLLVTIVATAWFTFPQVPEHDKAQTKGGKAGEEVDVKSKDAVQDDSTSSEGAANATFAVLRSYNFQTALSSLGTKSNATSNGAADAAGEGAGQESMSVYQSMYRSVFDRSKTALNRNPLTEEDEASSGAQARIRAAVSARNVFHIVLRHGHLMLYDSPAELEVRHVISMAHHTVSLSDGDGDDESMQDADLFIKRTAILLKPHASTVHGDTVEGSAPQPKPFYLFSSNCSEKEDFYHALVAAQAKSPLPQPLDSACSIKLQSSIHSNTLTPETRAFNALINRVFLALHRTTFLEDVVREKIEKKIARVAKPAFISYVSVQSIDLGDAGPILSNPRLKDIHISGDMVLSMDIKYTGGVKVVISAIAKLDLGQRFKVRTVDLMLAGSLQRLQGRLLIRIKPPPSNRIWFCFENIPDMDIKIEPIVSSRQITYNWILRTIENRIREVFAETLVKPNWDDVPFFDTHGQEYRGGIWQQQREESDESRLTTSEPTTQDFLSAKNEKTMSMPNLPKSPGGSAASSGVQTPVAMEQAEAASEQIQRLKQRSVTSLPSQSAQAPTERPGSASRPMRSPSFASPPPSAPSVAVDGSNVDAFRTSEVPQPAKRWIGRSPAPASKRDAVDAVREMNDRVAPKDNTGVPQSPSMNSSTVITEGGSEDHPDIFNTETDELDNERRGSAANRSSDNLHPNSSDTSFPIPRTPSRESISRTDTASSTRSSQTSQPRGKALFAATAAATSAARQWTLNAVANRKQGAPIFRTPNAPKPGPQEPIGRGQPLPPIGQPLPGPKTTSLWGGSGFAGGSVRRKPVLPARRPTSEHGVPNTEAGETDTGLNPGKRNESVSDASEGASERSAAEARTSEEDEFGAWNENYGESIEKPRAMRAPEDLNARKTVDREPEAASYDRKSEPAELTSRDKKGPAPPLPARRKRAPDLPKRPLKRDEGLPDHNELEPAAERQPSVVSEVSGTPEPAAIADSRPAVPAPVIDAEAEKRGTLELEEADGVHVIDAPAESSAGEDKSSERSKLGLPSRNVTMEEVPEESDRGNSATT